MHQAIVQGVARYNFFFLLVALVLVAILCPLWRFGVNLDSGKFAAAIASQTFKSRLFEYPTTKKQQHIFTIPSCPTSIVDEVADERVPTTIDTEEIEEETTPK